MLRCNLSHETQVAAFGVLLSRLVPCVGSCHFMAVVYVAQKLDERVIADSGELRSD